MKVTRSRARPRRKLSVLIPIRTKIENKPEEYSKPDFRYLSLQICMLFHTACWLPKAALHRTALVTCYAKLFCYFKCITRYNEK